MFQRILVPMDDSSLSDRALDAALTLADGSGGEVFPLFVRAVPLGDDVPYMDDLDVAALERTLVEDVARRMRAGHSVAPERVHPRLRTGEPAACILEACKDHGIDLIVMGTHGRHGWVEWLTGSTTERVLQGAPCNLLVLKDPPEA